MDWAAAMSSEIFREYAKTELAKEANKPIEDAENFEKELDARLAYHKKFDEFQKKVDASPRLQEYIKACKIKLQDPEIRKQADEDFVNGIDMLVLDDNIDDEYDFSQSSEKNALIDSLGNSDELNQNAQKLIMYAVDEIRGMQQEAIKNDEPITPDELSILIDEAAEEIAPSINKSVYESKMIISELL